MASDLSALPLGATPCSAGAHFAVWAPNARRVVVRLLDRDGRVRGEHALPPRACGTFAGCVHGASSGDDYLLVLDDERALPDPASRWQPYGVHGASRIVDPSAFAWSDDAWRGLPTMADYVIYELHVGTFTEAGTFDAVVPHLGRLRALGVTAIELMPVAEFPGARNWGYDGVALWAPHSAYGGPDGLRRLIDAAHREQLAVVLDVVYNHLGPEGNYLDAFGPYFTERYRTPWGRAVNYDGPGSDEVRRFVIENACRWIDDFHVDALRLDAIHGIVDASATHVLAELTDAVRARGAASGRTVHLIAESDLNDPRVVRPTSEHGLGFDAQWADDLHHAVHAALTGERSGYYADFGGAAPVIETLASPYLAPGAYSPFRGRRHGASAAGVPRDRFVVCAQNHDQVGNRAAGDRLTTLVDLPRLKLAAAVVLLSGYVPLLFMGEEYGETRPFQYFVSHGDPGLVRAVRDGRRREFASFGWDGEVPDPQAESTFVRSRLDHDARHTPTGRALSALYRDLLQLRRELPALRPGGATAVVDGDADAGWASLRFGGGAGGDCMAVFNLTGEPCVVPLGSAAAPASWACRLSTDAVSYAGAGGGAAPAPDGRVPLAPWSAALYVATSVGPVASDATI